jgi:hypothetical protein
MHGHILFSNDIVHYFRQFLNCCVNLSYYSLLVVQQQAFLTQTYYHSLLVVILVQARGLARILLATRSDTGSRNRLGLFTTRYS